MEEGLQGQEGLCKQQTGWMLSIVNKCSSGQEGRCTAALGIEDCLCCRGLTLRLNPPFRTLVPTVSHPHIRWLKMLLSHLNGTKSFHQKLSWFELQIIYFQITFIVILINSNRFPIWYKTVNARKSLMNWKIGLSLLKEMYKICRQYLLR